MGVRAGDLITQVGDLAITRQLDIERALLGRKPGDRVPVTVVRAGAEERVEILLAAMQRDAVPLEQRCWREVGLRLELQAAASVQKLQSRYRGGLLVAEVREGGPAAEQGIRPGDILVGLHVWETISLDNLTDILDLPPHTVIKDIEITLRGQLA